MSTRFLQIPYRQLWPLLAPHRKLLLRLIGAACLLILTEGVGLSLVFLVLGSVEASHVTNLLPLPAALLTELAAASPQVRVYWAAAALLVLMSLRGLAQYIEHVTASRLRISIEELLQAQLFSLFHDVQLSFIQRRPAGTLLTALQQYTVQIGQLIFGIAKGITALLTLAAYIGVALYISWYLSLFALLLMAMTSASLRPLLITQAKRLYSQASEALATAGAIAHESLAGIQQIHLFNAQAWSKARFQTQLQHHHTLAYQGSQWAGLVGPIFGLLNAVAFAIFMIGAISLGSGNSEARLFQITFFLVIAYRLSAPLSQLNQLQAQIGQTVPALDAVLDLLQRHDKPFIQEGTRPFVTMQQGLCLEKVTFHYTAEEPPTLVDITLRIPKGKVTAIVGASGAGKSTLVNLILRLYDPTAGQICVDGVDLSTFTLDSWRARLAVVNQEPFLFHDSLLANLRFGKHDASEAQIQQAAMLAQAQTFMADLPQGLQTSLQERGVRLSGGQRQRVALTRALLRNAELLILDEATNELDAQTEQAFQIALDQGRGAQAILLIAHRLSTVCHADHIYVLDQGRIVEQGTHHQLLSHNGVYRQLVQAQTIH